MPNILRKLFKKYNIKIGRQVTRTPNKITINYLTMDYKFTSFVLAIIFILLLILDFTGLADIDISDYLLVGILMVVFYFAKPETSES